MFRLPSDGNISRADVSNAIDILGLKHNSFEYWTKLARRLDLSVCRSRHPINIEKHLPAGIIPYDVLEEVLRSGYWVPKLRFATYLKTRERMFEGRPSSHPEKSDDDIDMVSTEDSEEEGDQEDSEAGEKSESEDITDDTSSYSEDESSESDKGMNAWGNNRSQSEEGVSGGMEEDAPDSESLDEDNTENAALERLDQKLSREFVQILCDDLGLSRRGLPEPISENEDDAETLKRGLDTAGPWREGLRFRNAWEDKYMKKFADE
jgi:hypothetical protein